MFLTLTVLQALGLIFVFINAAELDRRRIDPRLSMNANPPESIWTRAFALLCLAEFLGYAQHFAFQPTLPLYITHLGGSPFIVGLVIAAFGVTSVISRPIIGYWADRWSESGVMALGMAAQAAKLFYCVSCHSALR